MIQFFFDLYDDEISRDDGGRDLPDLESSRNQAVTDARHMAAESVRGGHLNLTHYVEVFAPGRKPLFKDTFGEVVEIVE